MRKLKLDLDALSVESFAIAPDAEGVGTVHGRVRNQDWNTLDDACQGGGGGGYTQGTCIGPTFCCPPTWQPTCMQTCADTCGNITCLANWCTLKCP